MGSVKVNNTQGHGNKCRGVTGCTGCSTDKHAICTHLPEMLTKGQNRNHTKIHKVTLV